MKKKLLTVLLIAASTGMMFAGCGTAPEVPEQPQDNVVTETSTMTPTVPTEAPELTDAPTATVAPTDIPGNTEEPVAISTPETTVTAEPTTTPMPTATIAPTASVAPTATPRPTTTPWPAPTPGPTPSISQIEGPKKEHLSFPVYKCGEKGEEVLELVKSLREKNPTYSDEPLISFLTENYDYNQNDILYGVYNSGWKDKCIEIVIAKTTNRTFSEYAILKEIVNQTPYIEEDVIYAMKNSSVDWNEVSAAFLKKQLSFKRGLSYIHCIEVMKIEMFTDEQIKYAIETVNPDWYNEAVLKCNYYISGSSGISYSSLQDRLINSHQFDYDIAMKAVESIKDPTDWNNEAYKAAKYFGPYRSSKEDLIQVLNNVGFTDEQIEYAINKYGW